MAFSGFFFVKRKKVKCCSVAFFVFKRRLIWRFSFNFFLQKIFKIKYYIVWRFLITVFYADADMNSSLLNNFTDLFVKNVFVNVLVW